MSHVMLTEYQLANFRNLMKAGRGIALSDLGPQGAFNSMPKSMSRRAKDEDGEGAARRAVAVVMKALEAKLGDEDFAKLCDRLCDGEEPEEAEAEAEDDDPSTEFASPMEREAADKAAKDAKRRAKDKKGKDAPPPFEGKPKTHAMDSANDPRFDFLRDAAKVKPPNGSAYTDQISKARRAPPRKRRA